MVDDITAAAHYLQLLGSKPRRSPDGIISRAVVVPPPEEIKLNPEENAIRLERLSRQVERAQIEGLERARLRNGAEQGLHKLGHHGVRAELDFDNLVSLEALVVLDGLRPVVDFVSNRLRLDGSPLGEWHDVTGRDATIIEHVAQSVGRIDCGGRQLGTGFVVADQLVMTNRHVLEQAAQVEGGRWHFAEDLTICFDDQGGGDMRFALAPQEVVAIDEVSARDYVVIPISGAGNAKRLPTPLALEDTQSFVQHTRPVYVVGYPGKPLPGAERFSLLHRLFNCEYGRKRYCPGEISISLGTVQETTDAAVFGHDCSTLGGSSGSPVIDLGDNSATVVGVHFAGIKRVSNFAYSMAALRNDLDDLELNYV